MATKDYLLMIPMKISASKAIFLYVLFSIGCQTGERKLPTHVPHFKASWAQLDDRILLVLTNISEDDLLVEIPAVGADCRVDYLRKDGMVDFFLTGQGRISDSSFRVVRRTPHGAKPSDWSVLFFTISSNNEGAGFADTIQKVTVSIRFIRVKDFSQISSLDGLERQIVEGEEACVAAHDPLLEHKKGEREN